MKKVSCIIYLVLSIFLLCACGTQSSSNKVKSIEPIKQYSPIALPEITFDRQVSIDGLKTAFSTNSSPQPSSSDREWYECESCGRTFNVDDMYAVDDGNYYICEDCYEDGEYWVCEDCGTLVYFKWMVPVDDGNYYICEGCYDSGDYRRCEGCDEVYYFDELHDGYCEWCLDYSDYWDYDDWDYDED